jgi:hypothetical protein
VQPQLEPLPGVDPKVFAHLIGLGGHYHLYLTALDPVSMYASGFEVSGSSTAADGEWLLNLPFLACLLMSFGPAGDYEAFVLDETFLPIRASELFGGG